MTESHSAVLRPSARSVILRPPQCVLIASPCCPHATPAQHPAPHCTPCAADSAGPHTQPAHPLPFPTLPRYCPACSLLPSASAQACPLQRHPAAATQRAAQRQSLLLPPAASIALLAPERLVQGHPAASRAAHLRNADAHAVTLSSLAALCKGRVRAHQPGRGCGAPPCVLATGPSSGVAPRLPRTRCRRIMVSHVAVAVLALFGQQPFVVGNSPGSAKRLEQQRP